MLVSNLLESLVIQDFDVILNESTIPNWRICCDLDSEFVTELDQLLLLIVDMEFYLVHGRLNLGSSTQIS